MSSFTRIVLAVAASVTYVSCTNERSVPLSPMQPSTQTEAATLISFSEPGGFSTTDLYDAQGRVVQLTSHNELIWTPDGTHVGWFAISPSSAYWGPPTYFISSASTAICPESCDFSVRFGTENGQRRAFLTVDYGHENPGTLVDVQVVNGMLLVTQTSRFPPGTPTLSGTVTEMTPSGPMPVSGAYVDRSVPGGWQGGTTDANGFYRIFGLIEGAAEVAVGKAGYETVSQQLPLHGDQRFDVQIARR